MKYRIILVLLLLLGCAAEVEQVELGDTITVEYEGALEDGTVFDSSEIQGQPLTFTVGSGAVIRGFERAVIGLGVGEEVDTTISPDAAYGLRQDVLVQNLPRDFFGNRTIEVGEVYVLETPDGGQQPARVISFSDDIVQIDMNHPLAEQTLTFNIKIVSIE